jgi:hypothetical protein
VRAKVVLRFQRGEAELPVDIEAGLASGQARWLEDIGFFTAANIGRFFTRMTEVKMIRLAGANLAFNLLF